MNSAESHELFYPPFLVRSAIYLLSLYGATTDFSLFNLKKNIYILTLRTKMNCCSRKGSVFIVTNCEMHCICKVEYSRDLFHLLPTLKANASHGLRVTKVFQAL